MSGPLDLSLRLDYRHGLGELAPFFAALAEGRALGARCPACARCWLPPRPRCPDDGSPTEPAELAPTGIIRAETLTEARMPFAGAPAGPVRFVLAAFDGATNLTLGRMRDPLAAIAAGSRVRLAGAEGSPPHPAQHMIFEPAE